MTHLSGSTVVEALEVEDAALTEISGILEARRNFSLSAYKDKCMKRRIAVRMRSCRCLDTAAYCTLLRQSEQEVDLLKKSLTIHVSQFFRNPSMYEKLRADVLPSLFQMAGSAGGQLRFWSLGCAGGEEAYSLGIILREFFAPELLRTAVEIRATDIDTEILQAAVLAEYGEDRLKGLPDNIKERYFIRKGPLRQLSNHVREMVSFHHQNILDADMFQPCHLILCRNTLIYFTRTEQERILHAIAGALPAGGILVLGKSETLVGETRTLFAKVCPIERIYRRL